MTFQWGNDAIEAMRDMVLRGYTCDQIAVEIGAPSKSAVIGKCHRLGIDIVKRVNGYDWNAASDAILRRMWVADAPARAIALAIGGVTAAAVRNRGARLGLAQRTRSQVTVTTSFPRVSIPQPKAPHPKPVAFVPAPVVAQHISASPVHFLEALPGQCRYPLWSNESGLPIEDKFCCGDPAGQSSYCPHHTEVCAGSGWVRR